MARALGLMGEHGEARKGLQPNALATGGPTSGLAGVLGLLIPAET
jgi:hypothetical protein